MSKPQKIDEAYKLSPQDSKFKVQAGSKTPAHKKGNMVFAFKVPTLLPITLYNAKKLISTIFLSCLRNRELRQYREKLAIELDSKRTEAHEDKKEELSIPRSILSGYDVIHMVRQEALALKKQLGQKASLLLVLTGSPLVGAQCPSPYSCPDNIQPFPDAENGCNVTSFVEAFNNTFIFSCDFIKNLTASAADQLFQASCQACMYPTTPTPVINNCKLALSYANETLCETPPPNPVNNMGNEFDWRWLLMFLVLVPCGAWCTWEICKRKVDTKNLFGIIAVKNNQEDEKGVDELRLAGQQYGGVNQEDDGAEPAKELAM